MNPNNRIIKLPKNVSEKIAAGEVVTGPLAVVKELTENAVDAGASTISVEIKDGGKTFLRVSDDGCGIAADDIELAFTPHATSKIGGEDDLERIDTLGFRGEALASIAAVSRLEMTTKTKAGAAGVFITVEGGEIKEIRETGAADGTAVAVRDLFYNTPARQKFMRSERAESASVVDFVSRLAVAYPNIRFRMKSNDAILFSTNGKGDVLKTILTVYGDPGGALIPVHFGADNQTIRTKDGADVQMSLHAWISGPNLGKKSRRSQVLFVNGRVVTDAQISAAISEAYKEFMFEGRYPVAYLFLQMPPADVDVNVHPAKSEIRFRDSRAVVAFVKETLRNALLSADAIPKALNMQDPKQRNRAWREEKAFYSLRGPESNNPGQSADPMTGVEGSLKGSTDPAISFEGSQDESPNPVAGIEGNPIDQLSAAKQAGANANGKDPAKSAAKSEGLVEHIDIKTLWSPKVSEHLDDLRYGLDGSADCPKGNADHGGQLVAQQYGDSVPAGQAAINDSKGAFIHAKTGAQSQFEIEYLRVLGAVFSTYLVASDDECLYIVDQHAAHERINYERFLASWRGRENVVQELLAPYILDIPAVAIPTMDEWTVWLSRLGFEAAVFGERSIVVKTFPAFLAFPEAEGFLRDIIDSANGAPPENDRALNRLISNACRKSIRGGDHLDASEIKALLKELVACDNPYTCPHGRPVFIKLSESDLERLFKRA